ncbi:hypothetical protein C3489_12230 [Streptomyces sp. Ru71]|uniref:hypothetical protein n=1 Tax=Streptomyces sp. Ru71 TaxID=2080746 RepID=UPI000CDCED79|nr:hypothetical protein [Streptomyces sp. Ru71]POX55145.1 hypothetical protein C3489_12230 [Streptomyces sp. Ru71]
MRSATVQRAVEWLAAAARDPRACKRDWDRGTGTVLLEAGRMWDVLSVPERLGLCALDVMHRTVPGPLGPTLVDCVAHRVGFFLPPDPAGAWEGVGVRHSGAGAWVAVPPPYRASGCLEWLVPPDGCGTLYDAHRLEPALREASGVLTLLTSDALLTRDAGTPRCL